MRDAGKRYARVLGYCRVSSEKQADEGTSLDAQKEDLETYCKENGYPRPTLFVEVESGGYAAREKRTEQKRLERELRAGDLVLVTVCDRWSRDAAYTLDSVRRTDRAGATWIAIRDRIDSSDDEYLEWLIQKAADSEREKARIRARTVGARRRMRAQGKFVEGRAPLGYRVEKHVLVIVPEEAEAVRESFRLCIRGLNLREIGKALKEQYPKARGMDPSGICKRLRDRRYLGEINTLGDKRTRKPKGKWIKAHEAIVDAETWERAQEALTGRSVGGRPAGREALSASYMLRGILRCAECGYVLSSWTNSKGDDGYYHCRRKHIRARQDHADAEVIRQAREHLETLVGHLSKPRAEVKRIDVAATVKRLEDARARVVDALADGIIGKEDARRKLDEIAAKVEAARGSGPAPRMDIGPDDVFKIRAAWDGATVGQRREILRLLSKRITITRKPGTKRWDRDAWTISVEWKET